MSQKVIQGTRQLSEKIRNRRLELGLTIEEAASKASVGTKTWCRYEAGESIRRDKAKGICKALNWHTLPDDAAEDAHDFDIAEFKNHKAWSTYLYQKREAFGFSFSPSSFIPHRGQLQLLLQQGIPQAVQFAAVVISVLFVGAHINAYGVAAGAANGIAAKLENILRIGAGSMSTAGCTMVAQNTGAGKPERVKKSVYCVLGISTIYALAISAVLIFCPKQVFALFDSDPEVLACAQIYVWPGVVTYLAYASRAAFTSVYNGVGNARLSLFSGLMDGVAARIGLSFLLGSVLNLGLVGYWYGYGLAGHVSALIGLIYFASGRWKSYKMLS